MRYLHTVMCMNLVHRDVKTANILLDHNLTAKIGDFGVFRSLPDRAPSGGSTSYVKRKSVDDMVADVKANLYMSRQIARKKAKAKEKGIEIEEEENLFENILQHTHVRSALLQGSWGYLCPQYARTGHLTSKADVFR